jgi:hypothetical protein
VICISPGVLLAIFSVLGDLEFLNSFFPIYTVRKLEVFFAVFLGSTIISGAILLSSLLKK